MTTTWHIDSLRPRRTLTGPTWALVTDRPPVPAYPSGFVARYAAVTHAVAGLGPTWLVVGRSVATDDPGRDARELAGDLRTSFPDVDHVAVAITPSERGAVQSLRRAVARTAARRARTNVPGLPPGFHPRGARLLLAHSSTAHLGAIEGVRATYLLEEGFERQLPGGLPRSLTAAMDRVDGAMLPATYRRVAASGRPVVVLSEHERDHFARWIPPRSIHVVPLGVDLEAFTAPALDPPDRRPSEPWTVGVVGRLGDARNVVPLLEVLRAARGRPWRWRLVGADPHPDLVAAAAADPAIEVTGAVERIEPHYLGLGAVLVPATVATGSKTTVLQAWAAGVACVVAEPSASVVPMVDGIDGLVYGSPEEAVEALATLERDDDLRAALVRAGHRRAEERSARALAADIVSIAST